MSWQIVTAVTGPFALLALFLVVLFNTFRVHTKRNKELIEAAPLTDRGPLIDKVLGEELNLPGLPSSARAEIALRRLSEKERTTRLIIYALLGVAAMFTIMTLYSIYRSQRENAPINTTSYSVPSSISIFDLGTSFRTVES